MVLMSTRDEDGLLEVRAVRRQQLTTAALHGSSRSWMSRRRRLPAVIGGIVLAGAIVLGVGITQVVRAQVATNKPQPTGSAAPR
jgi:hypothetical protein